LGLAISAKIIERLNGTIKAENVPSGGLNIIITLPIAEL
jgi:signal transduction histidine kinase